MRRSAIYDAERGGYEPADAEAKPQAAPTGCLNCGADLTGPFCSHCGQRNIPPYPSVRELAVDAFWELSGWDGRFASTVRMLFRRPGQLTCEFLEGRRARYLSPLRLYLMASLVYFVAAAAAPNVQPGAAVEAGGIKIGVFTPIKSDPDPGKGGAPVTAEEKKAALDSIADAPALLRPVLARAIEDPLGFRSSLLQAMPRMLFALLPVFALILGVFYRGRNYPEHLYFAIHLHAFIFLALTLSELSKFSNVLVVSVIVGIAVALWIPIYTHRSLMRVYGDSTGRTLAKGVGIGALYLVASVPALIGLTFWAART